MLGKLIEQYTKGNYIDGVEQTGLFPENYSHFTESYLFVQKPTTLKDIFKNCSKNFEDYFKQRHKGKLGTFFHLLFKGFIFILCFLIFIFANIVYKLGLLPRLVQSIFYTYYAYHIPNIFSKIDKSVTLIKKHSEAFQEEIKNYQNYNTHIEKINTHTKKVLKLRKKLGKISTTNEKFNSILQKWLTQKTKIIFEEIQAIIKENKKEVEKNLKNLSHTDNLSVLEKRLNIYNTSLEKQDKQLEIYLQKF